MHNAPLLEQLQHALVLEEARRKQNANLPETEARVMLAMLRDSPAQILEDKATFKKAAEQFLWILDKNRAVRQFKLNRSQEIFVDAYFEMKAETPAVRINILKGRQQGMSTMIGACAVLEMIARENTNALIISEEKGGSGENIFKMYQMYFTQFQELLHAELDSKERSDGFWGEDDITRRFKYGHAMQLPNGSGFNVVGEKLVTSRTLQFIHLSEAAFFGHLKDVLGMLNQTIPKTSTSAMFIETTAKEYGNDYYDEWIGACAGRSAFKPLFLPWFIHEEYQKPFPNDTAKAEFEKSLGDSEEHEYGNERGLLETNLEDAVWRKHWKTIDFRGYETISLENLNWRRLVIRELNGVIPEFNRQYPTTPEMAFLSNSAHVLDMNAVRWYMNNQVTEAARGSLIERVPGTGNAQYVEQRGGILHTWEHPMPDREYIIGVDVAEGKDAGDFSCAYVVSRLPFRIVCKLRGYDGRRINLEEFSRQLFLLGKYYNSAVICPENNAQGSAVVISLSQMAYPNLISESVLTLQPSTRFGWMNTHGMREYAIAILQEVIHSRQLFIPDAMLLDEMHHFVYVNGRPQAARKGSVSMAGITLPGSHDDGIFALLGALLANSRLPRPKTEEEMKHEALLAQRRKRERTERRNSPHGADWMQHI